MERSGGMGRGDKERGAISTGLLTVEAAHHAPKQSRRATCREEFGMRHATGVNLENQTEKNCSDY